MISPEPIKQLATSWVRGNKRKARGHYFEPAIARDSVLLPYEGLDEIERRTLLQFSPEPKSIDAGHAIFDISLPPGGETALVVTASFESGSRSRRSMGSVPAPVVCVSLRIW